MDSQKQLAKLTHAQRERLAFIDFSLEFIGEISRAELTSHFQTGLAAATRDLTAYKELAPENMHLVHQTKSYHRAEDFKPLFEHDPEMVLNTLMHGFGDGLASGNQHSVICFDAVRLIQPRSAIIGTLMRAIHSKRAVQCRYVSLSSGETERTLVPHSLVNNGHRWHVRAFDRSRNAFRDFVCTRFLAAQVAEVTSQPHELRDADKQWNRIVDLELIPHPGINNPQAIELDYGMQNGKRILEVRAALAGYLLRQWSVDCSEGHQLSGSEHQLALANPQALYGVSNIAIAPGYQTEKKPRKDS
ncbi:WYL domain-containing protein [Dongshaea marina]|uniref:WYL domain-containing protein n=1 Tax=Dongshaea marina TaxID=2047966 RepID=UPI000D3E7C3A|nr:WYL domain-containing protein [Dongshaea marina]